MALTFHCTMRGANVVANDLEIRREIAVCSHCSTLLRITRIGMEAYRDALQTLAAPAGVIVRREKPGSLTITAPRTTKALVINRPELGRGVRAGIAIGVGITAAAGVLSLPLWLIFGAGIATFIAVGLLLILLPSVFLAVLASIAVAAAT